MMVLYLHTRSIREVEEEEEGEEVEMEMEVANGQLVNPLEPI